MFDLIGLRGANSLVVGVGLSAPLMMILFWGTSGNNENVDERFVDGDVARRCGLCGSWGLGLFMSVYLCMKYGLSWKTYLHTIYMKLVQRPTASS